MERFDLFNKISSMIPLFGTRYNIHVDSSVRMAINDSGFTDDIILSINPIDLLVLITKPEDDFIKTTVTRRVAIQLAIKLINLKKPNFHFKDYDIVKEIKSNAVYYVINYCETEEYYVLESVISDKSNIALPKDFVEENFKKIGEVTKDVLRSLIDDQTTSQQKNT